MPGMRYASQPNQPEMSPTEQARLHVLMLCVTRFVVEKHGGAMETDPATHTAYIRIPASQKAACFEELGEVLAHMPRELTPCKEAPGP
jgi:hypothetical protein